MLPLTPLPFDKNKELAMVLPQLFRKWQVPGVIAICVIYTYAILHVFRTIYPQPTTSAAAGGDVSEACHSDVPQDGSAFSSRRLRGATKYRTVSALDVPGDAEADMPLPRLPTALLLGFSKCGTSALLAFLHTHPDIVAVDWETDYFCDRVYSKYSLHWYRMRMPASTQGQVTVEKSPCYISEPQAILRIKAMNASVKVMVIVRNPIIRILSEYSHYLQTAKNFGKTPMSLEDRYMDDQGAVREHQVQKWGVYTERMAHLYMNIPRAQILLLDGDSFVRDPLPVLRHIEQFLGVTPSFTRGDFFFDETKGFYCITARDPRGFQATLESGCMDTQKGRPHVKMDNSLRQKLINYLKPHNEQLFKLVGRRFNWD